MSLIKSANGINIAGLARLDGVLKSGVKTKNGIINLRPLSLLLDGNNDYIDFGDQFYISSNISISFWVKILSNQNNKDIFSKWSTSDNKRAFRCNFRSGTNNVLNFAFSRDGTLLNYTEMYSNSALSLDTWYHVVATYTSGNASTGGAIYVNGSSVAKTASITGTMASIYNSTGSLSAGCLLNAGSPANLSNIILDQVRVFSGSVLTSTDVTNLYAIKPAVNPLATFTPSAATPVAFYPIGETADSWATTGGIIDRINGYNGTMQNFDPAGSFSTDVAA